MEKCITFGEISRFTEKLIANYTFSRCIYLL